MNEVKKLVEKYFKDVPNVQEFEEIKCNGKKCDIEEIKETCPQIVRYIDDLKKRLNNNLYAESICFYRCKDAQVVLLGKDDRTNERSKYALIDGNHVFCPSGNANGDGHLNEFANNIDGFVPNSFYHMENVTYRIDEKGRVCEMFEYHVTRRLTNRCDSHGPMKSIAEALDGKKTDVGGHLVAHSIDGPSEAINIVPMDETFNNTGDWKKMEMCFLNAYQKHIDFWVHKIIKYTEETSRPSHIEVNAEVDGKSYNWSFGSI